jgi:uncharacterized membrane protein YeaQ/YmgE (transglycosylase-associated protein family)
MSLFSWILIGGLLGWAASIFMQIRNWPVVFLNVATGISGVLLGGWLLGGLTGSSAFNPGEFSLGGLLVSLLGATVLLAAVHLLGGIAKRLVVLRRHPTSAVFELSRSWENYEGERTEMNKTIRAGRVLRPLITAGLAGMLLLVGGCATAPVAPDSAMDAAKVAISNAEKAEAGQFAGAELGEAREKLALADNAVRDENMVVAERFAQESRVQAELASARTAAAKAVAVNKEMERGADALTEEMKRAGESK